MPCFKGLAVSVHTPDGPIAEFSIQKQSRVSRITSYIPVPPPKIPSGSSSKPEQSTFAISITLLTPGLPVPYSTPKFSIGGAYPRPQMVGGLPGVSEERGRYSSVIGPYVPLTTSPNETIAAYIYFDGRQKEEVATLLRRGEETWVNSRWVSVPDSEGGGLAEREFLFREVGLERWLNGLDLEGKDVAAKIERRRQKMEKKRRKRKDSIKNSDDEDEPLQWARTEKFDKGVLRYGADERSPLEKISDEDELFSSDESDDDPVPEATGQIKVALFRVLASGEIKKGEYSPQFDAHDDDEDSMKTANGNAKGESSGEADIDHTTSFAKPKQLDPQTISTQTVTTIDGPEKPYAVFTFLYRGEKQLQKMGIIKSKSSQPSVTHAKRRSVQTGFANLKPLKPGGALGFTQFRDGSDGRRQSSGNRGEADAMESDEEDDGHAQVGDAGKEGDGEEGKSGLLSAEDARRTGELAEGVKKIKLKRQHSFEPPRTSASPAARAQSKSNSPTESTPPTLLSNAVYDPKASTQQDLPDPWLATNLNANQDSWGEPEKDLRGGAGSTLRKDEDQAIIGSPLKKQRASMSGDNEFTARLSSLAAVSGSVGGVLGLGLLSDVTGGDTGAGAGPVDFGGELQRVDVTAGGVGSAVDGVGVGLGSGEASGPNPLGAVRVAPTNVDAMEEEEEEEEEL